MLWSTAVAHADGYQLRAHVAQAPPPPVDKPKIYRCDPQIRPFIERERPRVEQCVAVAARHDPRLAGTVVAKFYVGNDGVVAEATATGVSAALAGCIARAMAQARFPRGLGGLTVAYPVTIVPASGVAR